MQMSMPTLRKAASAIAAVYVLAACSDAPTTAPAAGPHGPAAAQAPGRGTVPASIEWNEVARALVARNNTNAINAFRTYALVSVAQERALEAVEAAPARDGHPSLRAAIAAASVEVLSAIYGGETTWLEAQLAARLGSGEWAEQGDVDVPAGEALGRAAGEAVMAEAATDGYTDPWTGSPKNVPGAWFSSASPPAPPVGASLENARPFLLQSPSQFRPGPHPAYGSPEFLAQLDEVYQYSLERNAMTAEGRMMDSIAKFWAFGARTYTPGGYWNDVASQLAVRHGFNEVRATRMLALLNKVAFDAIIASNDAKVHYWLLRPSQADTRITLSLNPLPNFPSYPSNHATISAAMAEVIAAVFPSHADALRAAADEAALSRVYGGIHYRFDGDAGVTLGRQVAQWALEQLPNVHAGL